MKIALAQFNPTIGDFDGNVARILELAAEAKKGGADLAVFSELEDACRRPYPSATARRLEIDRLCLDIWQRITARDERNPYTVRDLRRIQGIQARSASAPAASDS